MDTKGGRFTLTINGVAYSGRGKATIKPSRVSMTNGANMDGTGYSTVKPTLAELDLSFDRGVGLVWDENLLLQPINATFVETDVGVTHLFTGGNFEGDSAIDTENGEVTGLKIQSDRYQVLT
jgi:hypothetical protein